MNWDHLTSIAPELGNYTKDVDHLDLKHIESTNTMHTFLFRSISYTPGWMRFLYKLRKGLAALMGLKHDAAQNPEGMTVDDISYTPGEMVAFFQVSTAERERFWIGEARDKHLSGWIVCVREPLENGRSRFYTGTIVKYRHWTGPVYFNLIRPFHHLVVEAMQRYAAKTSD